MIDQQYLNNLVFYRTGEFPCSYLDDRPSRTLFLDPDVPLTPELLEILNLNGFRRSGHHVYRPDCVGCTQCQSSRILVKEFRWRRSLKRVLKLNEDLVIKVVPNEFTQEHYELFELYVNTRHADGDMYPTSPENYQDFLISNFEQARLVEFRLHDKLIAASCIDLFQTGPSAIYTYFDPKYSSRSPGTMAVLFLVKLAERMNMPFVYLGYWIKDSEKMAYKAKFQPLEVYIGTKWYVLAADLAANLVAK